MKKGYIIFAIAAVVVLSFIGPFLINESYKVDGGYVTFWEAKDVLSYFGTLLGALGTIFIGLVALFQSNQANEISHRLLQLEEKNSTPYLHIDIANSKINTFKNDEINISIYFRNSTEHVINIIEINDLKLDDFIISEKGKSIPFCGSWTHHYSVLPNQSRDMNFYGASKDDESLVVDFAGDLEKDKYMLLRCQLNIALTYVNSIDRFTQTYDFMIHTIYDKDSIKPLTVFTAVESTVSKIDIGKTTNT